MSEPFSERPLTDLAELVMGQSPDSQYVHDDLEHGMPFLQGNAEFGDIHPHPVYSCSQPARACKKNDVLISVRAPVGEINVANTDYCIGRGLAAIRFRYIPATLGAKLVSKFSPALKRVAQGTTFEAIGKNELASLGLLVPPSSEWKKIAQILDTLDTQIRQTEALIAKLERLKQGLLTDLLTRGIDQNGQLRPTPDQAPHLYKDSPLGRIPREWEESTVGREFEIQLGKMLDAEKNVGELKPYLGNKSVQWERVDLSEISEIRLTKSDQEKFRLRPGDLLVCEGGEVGRAALWEGQMDECYYQKALHRLRPTGSFRPELMLQFLRFWSQRDMLANYSSQTSIAHLTKEKLATIPLPRPPFDEQQLMVEAFLLYRKREESEAKQLSELTDLKAGLMDDLLTGRVRVTPLLDAAERMPA